MSTTTIRLPEGLKARVTTAAKRADTTAHSFILEAISEKTERAEYSASFHAEADARLATIAATGKSVSWEQMRGYIEARVAGTTVKRPVSHSLARKLGR